MRSHRATLGAVGTWGTGEGVGGLGALRGWAQKRRQGATWGAETERCQPQRGHERQVGREPGRRAGSVSWDLVAWEAGCGLGRSKAASRKWPKGLGLSARRRIRPPAGGASTAGCRGTAEFQIKPKQDLPDATTVRCVLTPQRGSTGMRPEWSAARCRMTRTPSRSPCALCLLGWALL